MSGPLIGAALLTSAAPAGAAVTWTKGAFAVGDVSSDGETVNEDIIGLGCTDDTVQVHSFLIQGGVIGRGHDVSDCTGEPEIVTLSISSVFGTFAEGPARLCAVAISRDEAGRPVDAIARCEEITLA